MSKHGFLVVASLAFLLAFTPVVSVAAVIEQGDACEEHCSDCDVCREGSSGKVRCSGCDFLVGAFKTTIRGTAPNRAEISIEGINQMLPESGSTVALTLSQIPGVAVVHSIHQVRKSHADVKTSESDVLVAQPLTLWLEEGTVNRVVLTVELQPGWTVNDLAESLQANGQLHLNVLNPEIGLTEDQALPLSTGQIFVAVE